MAMENLEKKIKEGKKIRTEDIIKALGINVTKEEFMTSWKQYTENGFWFIKNLKVLINEYPNKWVGISDRKVIDSDYIRENLEKRLVQKGFDTKGYKTPVAYVRFVPEKEYHLLLTGMKEIKPGLWMAPEETFPIIKERLSED